MPLTLAPIVKNGSQNPPGNSKIAQSVAWLLYGGGMEAWRDRAMQAGIMNLADQKIFGDIAAMLARTRSVSSGQAPLYDGYQNDQTQIQQLIAVLNGGANRTPSLADQPEFKNLPLQWQSALRPMLQFVEAEQRMTARNPMVTLSEAAANHIVGSETFQTGLQNVMEQMLQTQQKPLPVVKGMNVAPTAANSGWFARFSAGLGRWLHSWMVFLWPDAALQSAGPA